MRFAVIGDIHGFWDARDTAFFNAAAYDALLFVGDFARVVKSYPVARQLSNLTTPAWAIPGNHDGVTLAQLLAEVRHRPRLARITSRGMTRRVRKLARTMAPVRLGGYSLAPLSEDLGLLIARPHAMGPDCFHYRDYLRDRFDVDDFDVSAARLCALVDRSPRDIVMLAHNGPSGLGDTPDSPFGCDFGPERGDFGAPDLRAAIDHAHATGHRVRAVLAGHMHHRSKHSGVWRTTATRDAQTFYINAARVPRITQNGARRHHIDLEIGGETVTAHACYVNNDGNVVGREPIAD